MSLWQSKCCIVESLRCWWSGCRQEHTEFSTLKRELSNKHKDKLVWSDRGYILSLKLTEELEQKGAPSQNWMWRDGDPLHSVEAEVIRIANLSLPLFHFGSICRLPCRNVCDQSHLIHLISICTDTQICTRTSWNAIDCENCCEDCCIGVHWIGVPYWQDVKSSQPNVREDEFLHKKQHTGAKILFSTSLFSISWWEQATTRLRSLIVSRCYRVGASTGITHWHTDTLTKA